MLQQTSTEQPYHEPAGRNKSPLLKIKGCHKYPVKMKTDKETCDIVSACALEDGTVIIADYNNMKLKCLNRSTVTASCDLSGYPWQVCAVSQQDIAVACEFKCVIQFVSVVRSTLQMTWSISLGFRCSGVAYADDKLYVAGVSSVYVYTLSGTRLNQFSQDQSGQDLFFDIRSLVISKDNSWIYIADEDKGLIILNINGQPVGQFIPPELNGAYGVCLHKTGNVLVCGHRSNNVLQFDADGQLIGEILKTDKGCYAICFNKNYSKLIICYQDNDEIEIHDIL